MVSFMIFTASVWKLLDQPMYIGDLVNQWAVICEFCPGCYVSVGVIVPVAVVVSVL